MRCLNEYLLPNEHTGLIEALRRDVENERNRAALNPSCMAYHLQNARLSVRILEAFGYRLERDDWPD